MRSRSLALRLVLFAALWIAAALVAGGVVLSSLFRESVERSFDARLVVLLESLVAASEVAADGTVGLIRAIGEPRFEQAYSGWYWQIEGAGPAPSAPAASAFPSAATVRTAAGSRTPDWRSASRASK